MGLVKSAQRLAASRAVAGEVVKLEAAQARGDMPQVANSLAALLTLASHPSSRISAPAIAALGAAPGVAPRVELGTLAKALPSISSAYNVAAPLGAQLGHHALALAAPTISQALGAAVPGLAVVGILSTIATRVQKEIAMRKAHKQSKHSFLRLRDQLLANLTGKPAGAYIPSLKTKAQSGNGQAGGAVMAPPLFLQRDPCQYPASSAA